MYVMLLTISINYIGCCELIKMGKAYVDSLNEEEIREYRGTEPKLESEASMQIEVLRRI